ncbi:LysE/ArgO family amino acid transporter [Acinetobacter celticus]|uniref:Amino acid transporter n=1 Tax=Acinetobacter celticus TaxID=1891224 RepID=A0A1C3CWX0_9GAMM|nr:LysE/ArgO family amino acid transporter [Acinetobacter celticus]ODA13197.1 amino acid transporter [Acinetobacter celticus]
MFSTYLQGLMIGLSLIVAIGAQNTFVLKQGLKKQNIFWVCFVCALSDSVLTTLGIAGFSSILHHYPSIIQFAKWGGALFLIWYGYQHAVQALKSQQTMQMSSGNESNLIQSILMCLALTWLNPHVYLDTVIFMGSISTQFEHTVYFALGAVSASWLFFFALGYGARVLIPIFESPKAWRVLDAIIAFIMWGIASSLLVNT